MYCFFREIFSLLKCKVSWNFICWTLLLRLCFLKVHLSKLYFLRMYYLKWKVRLLFFFCKHVPFDTLAQVKQLLCVHVCNWQFILLTRVNKSDIRCIIPHINTITYTINETYMYVMYTLIHAMHVHMTQSWRKSVS